MSAPTDWDEIAERNASKGREALAEALEAAADFSYQFAATKASEAHICLRAAAHFAYVARAAAREAGS